MAYKEWHVLYTDLEGAKLREGWSGALVHWVKPVQIVPSCERNLMMKHV